MPVEELSNHASPRAIQQRGQRLACVGLLRARNFFGRSLRHDAAAPLAAFRPQIDDPIGLFHHVEVVLDNDNRVAEVGETVKHVQELLDICKCKPVVGSSRM